MLYLQSYEEIKSVYKFKYYMYMSHVHMYNTHTKVHTQKFTSKTTLDNPHKISVINKKTLIKGTSKQYERPLTSAAETLMPRRANRLLKMLFSKIIDISFFINKGFCSNFAQNMPNRNFVKPKKSSAQLTS